MPTLTELARAVSGTAVPVASTVPDHGPVGLGLVWDDRGVQTNRFGPYRDVGAEVTPLFVEAWGSYTSRDLLKLWGFGARDNRVWVYCRALPPAAQMAEVEARAQASLDRLAREQGRVLQSLQVLLADKGWAIDSKLLPEVRVFVATGFAAGHDMARAQTIIENTGRSVERARESIADRVERVGADLRAACEDPELQRLALAACRHLSDRDGDLASMRNDSGWDPTDTRRGHVLAALPDLDAAHTAVAVALVRRYRLQLPDDMRVAIYGPEVARRRKAA